MNKFTFMFNTFMCYNTPMNTTKLKREIDIALAALMTEADCQTFHQKYLGKTGAITELLSGLKNLPADQRTIAGTTLNALKRDTEVALHKLQKQIKERELSARLLKDKLVDITVPDFSAEKGRLHPITIVMDEVKQAFSTMGFHIEDGQEIVTEFENFESLNVPKTHPARDMQDTFWLSDGRVLKTHTSASQNRMLKKYGPEFAAVFPGRCYRNEATDATHEMAFFQVEGMMVGSDISISNLIYFMKKVLTAVLKKELNVRLRPGFFPFVEPGFELDISCVFCKDGCGICKRTGWIEFCGCGMIHPNVLEMGGVDPTKYQGWAFGFGLTRLAMMKYNVTDVRVFNSGNIEALSAIC